MTVDTKWNLAGVHGANKYLWTKLQSELEWTDLNGAIPIIPTQQEPEFNGAAIPFIVYTYSLDGSSSQSWEWEETVTYSIFSANEKEIRQAVNLMVSLFKDNDISADRLNTYIWANESEDYRAFDYKYVATAGAAGPMPSEDEGDRKDGLVVVRLCYTKSNDPIMD